jgi:hypothetical protein
MRYYLITLIRGAEMKRFPILTASAEKAGEVGKALAHYENFPEWVISVLHIEVEYNDNP